MLNQVLVCYLQRISFEELRSCVKHALGS